MLSTSNTDPLKFALDLKKMRMKAELTQRELAEGLGISPAMVGRYEMGSASPSDKTLFAINRFFEQLNCETMITKPLSCLSLDDLLAEIRQRGFKVTIESAS